MSKFNITFKNKKYSIDKSLLSGAISSIEAVLSGLSGGDVPTPTDTLPAGLYETGAIALYEEQGAEAVEGMMIMSWDELLANGTVHVEDGVVYSNFDEADSWENASSDALAGDLVLPNDGSIVKLGDFREWYDENDGWFHEGRVAFGSCYNLTGVLISDSVTDISDYAFAFCSLLMNVKMNNGITGIGYSAFSECVSLTNITIPDSVTNMGSAFDNCTSLVNITISDSVTSIGECAFFNCESLTGIIIPDSVSSIGFEAFKNCASLDSITIGNNVTHINAGAFCDCSSLTTINYNGTVDQWYAIEKGADWDSGTGNYTIYCTDGNITKELPES